MTKEFEVREDVAVDAGPDDVWDAISTRDGLAAWFQPADIGPHSDIVVEWEASTRLVTEMPGTNAATRRRFEFVVDARDGGGTTLRFVHSGVERDDFDEKFDAQGWNMYLATLREYFAHFAGRPATYVEAIGPPSSADPAAWSRLLPPLGLSDPASLGDDARIELSGYGDIAGLVDYLTPNFIGIRAADALIRFHGRGPIGLPSLSATAPTAQASTPRQRGAPGSSGWQPRSRTPPADRLARPSASRSPAANDELRWLAGSNRQRRPTDPTTEGDRHAQADRG